MLILTLIKDTALPALTSAWLRVCVCTRLSAWLTGVQQLSGVSPYLNCAAPFYCITATLARAISVEYCHQSCVAAEAWELAVNLCVCLCACVPVNLWNDKCEQCVSVCVKLLASMQCVFFCSQMDRSIQVSPARTEEQCPFLQAFICRCGRYIRCCYLREETHGGQGGGRLRWGLLASQGKRQWRFKWISLPGLLFFIWLAALFLLFSQPTSPFFHVSITLVFSFSCSSVFAWDQSSSDPNPRRTMTTSCRQLPLMLWRQTCEQDGKGKETNKKSMSLRNTFRW